MPEKDDTEVSRSTIKALAGECVREQAALFCAPKFDALQLTGDKSAETLAAMQTHQACVTGSLTTMSDGVDALSSRLGRLLDGNGVSGDNIIYRSLDYTRRDKLGNIYCYQHKKSKQHLKGSLFYSKK